MDKIKLIEAFKATLVPEQREQAEVYLNEVRKISLNTTPNFIICFKITLKCHKNN